MLIQFEKTSGRATGDYQPGRSHMREGASRNPSFLSRCCSALIDIAAVASAILLICATGVSITVAIYFLLFCSF
jgi:hypothetical protein